MIDLQVVITHNMLDHADRLMSQALRYGANHAAEELRQRIADNVPVDTGALRDSIYVEERSSGSGVSFIIGSQLDSATCLEYGTVKMSPRPTFIPQTNAFSSEAAQIILKAINEALGG